MKNSFSNIDALIKVGKALGELNERIVYVGGAVVGLYATDLDDDDVRPTKDVDIVVEIATASELEELRKTLAKKGFRQTAEDDVICRFRLEDIKVDVMATKEVGWAPSNLWFALGFKNAESVKFDNIDIKVLPVTYFLASKFEAFEDPGNSDPFGSHDFEDIIYVFDNHVHFVKDILNAEDEVRKYLKDKINLILENQSFKEAILGNLTYQTQQERYDMIMNKLKTIGD